MPSSSGSIPGRFLEEIADYSLLVLTVPVSTATFQKIIVDGSVDADGGSWRADFRLRVYKSCVDGSVDARSRPDAFTPQAAARQAAQRPVRPQRRDRLLLRRARVESPGGPERRPPLGAAAGDPRPAPRWLGLGGYPLVSLAEARQAAFANRKLARAGGDPLEERRRERRIPTFEEAAGHVLALHRPGWRNAKHAAQWEATLRDYAFPHIGHVAVADVTTADVLRILTLIWHDKPETARRVRQRISAVMKWAVAQGHRSDNPAGDAIGKALPRHQTTARHMQALPHREVAGAIAAVRASKAWWATKAAFEFLVLTATRSGEVRRATWQEIDVDVAAWTVPAERMKANTEHRVPLSRRAIEILNQARVTGDGHELVFPSMRGKVLSDMTLSKLVKEQGIAAVPHGFRSSFRDWAAEQTGARHDVIEACLAHTVRNPTVAAYARSDLFERRRRLMDDWAEYLAGERAKVVPLRR